MATASTPPASVKANAPAPMLAAVKPPKLLERSTKPLFSRWFAAAPGRQHFAPHSHHPWPDASFDAQREAWDDAARLADFKWEKIFGEVVPNARAHVARVLHLSDASTVAFAPSTVELVMRAVSGLEGKGLAGGSPLRVLTTDSEFHSWVRQLGRLEEAGLAFVDRVPTEPFGTFGERFTERLRGASIPPDVIYTSHVFYNSGFLFEGVGEAIAAARKTAPDALFFLDGYHTFFALPVDVSSIEDHVFYLGGGYKYAMSGEGACFMHCPPGRAPRPIHTGWFAGFGDLTKGVEPGTIPFPQDGMRMWGATYDPVGLYRFNAVQDLWLREGVSVADIHAHVRALEEMFLDGLERRSGGASAGGALSALSASELIPGRREMSDRGHFLTFRTSRAGDIYAKLRELNVVTDYRKDRLRFGFGVAQDAEDVKRLVAI